MFIILAPNQVGSTHHSLREESGLLVLAGQSKLPEEAFNSVIARPFFYINYNIIIIIIIIILY